MESALFIAPMMMSFMMSSVAPVALFAAGGDLDSERIARGVAQVSVMSMRSVMDMTYDDLVLNDRTGDFSIRGIEVTLPEVAGVPGCTVKVDAMTVIGLDRPDSLSFASEGDGIEVNPACAGEQSAIIQSMLGPDAMNVTHYSATTSYRIGHSSLEYSVLLETAAAGSISINTQLEGLHFELDNRGEPIPHGEVTQIEVTLQDTEALRALLPIFGLDADPVAMATGAMGGVLSEGGISDAERALIDSANTELARVIEDGGSVTLRSGQGVAVSFNEFIGTDGPEDLVELLKPVFSSALVGADNLISSEMLKRALAAPEDLSPNDQLRVAKALASGEGAPRSAAKAAALLLPLAEGGNSEAALNYASLLHGQGDDMSAAYTYALAAGEAGETGARNILDRIESDLDLETILDLQASRVDGLIEPTADVASLRNAARQYANGRGASRNYGHALLLATLAAAGGDHSSRLLAERLSAQFEKDEDVAIWETLKAAQAEKALSLWADGFGDGFGTK